MDIAVQLGLVQRGPEGTKQRDILQAVKDWLVNEMNGDWLLVVDNADDHSVLFAPDTEGCGTGETKGSLANFLPQSPNGKVLITSRYKTLAQRLVGYRLVDVLEVRPMPHLQALDLMRKKLSVDRFEETSAFQLLEALDFIPLAIVQASAYINQRRPFTSIRKYLEDLGQNGPAVRHLLEHNAGDIDFGGASSRSILSTIKLSWDFIRKLRPTAVRLISLMVFFNCQSIQTFLLHRNRYQYAYGCTIRHYGRLRDAKMGGSHASDISKSPLSTIESRRAYTQTSSGSVANFESNAMDRSLHVHCKHPISNNEKEFEEDVHFLQDFSLVSISIDGSALQMHSLVRTAIRTWLKDLKEDKKWEYLSIQVLAEEFPLHTELEPLHFCEQLVTHVELDVEPPPYGDAFKDWAQIIVAVGSYASDRGDWCLERKTVEMALRFMNTHGRETFHKEVAFSVTTTLAFLLAETGDCAAAKMLLDSLEDDRKRLPSRHPDLHTDLRTRAEVCRNLGGFNEAEALLRKAFDTWRSIDGENGLRTLDAKYGLGIYLFGQERYEEARDILSSIKGQYEELYGEGDFKLLSLMFGLARSNHMTGEFEVAENLYQRILELLTEETPGNCWAKAYVIYDMGMLRQSQGRYDEAKILFRDALERHEDTVSKDDSEYAEKLREDLENVLRL